MHKIAPIDGINNISKEFYFIFPGKKKKNAFFQLSLQRLKNEACQGQALVRTYKLILVEL